MKEILKMRNAGFLTSLMCMAVMLFMLASIQSCSVAISHHKHNERKEVYSKLTIGTPRAEIMKTLGDPDKRDGEYIDLFSVCIPEESAAGFHIAMDMLTLGFWELAATPIEALKDCDKEEIVLVYDENNRIAVILSKSEYEEAKEVYSKLLKKVQEFSSYSDLALVSYNAKSGWSFADKNHIKCNFQNKYVKLYTKRVLPLYEALEYKSNLRSETTPLYTYSTFLIDTSNDQFKITSCNLYDEEGGVLTTIPNTDWFEMYPNTHIRAIADLAAYYCLDEKFKEYEEKEKPPLRDFFRDKPKQTSI